MAEREGAGVGMSVVEIEPGHADPAQEDENVHIWRSAEHAVCGSTDTSHDACSKAKSGRGKFVWPGQTRCERCGRPICRVCLIGCEIDPEWDWKPLLDAELGQSL